MKNSLISQATNTVELEEALESQLNAIGCELDPASTYQESMEWFDNDGEDRAVEILEEAIYKFHQLEE